MMVGAGVGCLTGALAVVLFLFLYLAEGAGLQLFGFFGVSSITVMAGLAHVVGFLAAASLLFLLGITLCAHGFVPRLEPPSKRPTPTPKRASRLIRDEPPEAAFRCVRCRIALATPVPICPECGWTQPNVIART